MQLENYEKLKEEFIFSLSISLNYVKSVLAIPLILTIEFYKRVCTSVYDLV